MSGGLQRQCDGGCDQNAGSDVSLHDCDLGCCEVRNPVISKSSS
jgi:hypothetical protein